MFTNANSLSFSDDLFDVAITGFMGWYDCFDFERNEFTQPDLKGPEIYRILRKGGRLVCCSWEAQQDLAWMEEAMLRHYPDILKDHEYLDTRPIGMAYEKPIGYRMILNEAGFRNISISRETAGFISTDEEEWWRQMSAIGWDSFFEKIEHADSEQLKRIKTAICKDLQTFKEPDGIHFTKSVFFVSGVK